MQSALSNYDRRKLISVVLPIFNEEKNIEVAYCRIKNVFKELSLYDHEIIMVNDGSTDSSWSIIKKIVQEDGVVIGLNFSRNFGHQIALTAGYDHANGDAVITMDADLQHPPELVSKLIEQWQKGFAIVYVQNKKRSDSFLKKWGSQNFYKILNKISDTPVLHNVADFRLIDKKVLAVVRTTKEKSRYLRGIISWTGFSYTVISGSFDQRRMGSSGYTWKKMCKLAFDGLTNFSLFPLKIASYIGLFVISTGILMLLFITIESIFYHAHYPLFKWLITIIYIFLGILFILLWIIGEYIGRIYEELKNRPLYIIKETCFSKKGEMHESDVM